MLVRCYSRGKFYTVRCPEGSRVVRCRPGVDGHCSPPHDVLVIPHPYGDLNIPADPPELLPMLAESGNFGVSLVGEPEPVAGLAGASCPECGQGDDAWLALHDDEVVCESCGSSFATQPASAIARGAAATPGTAVPGGPKDRGPTG